MSDDWLDIEPGTSLQQVSLLALVELPLDRASRTALARTCWDSLSETQRMLLTALRLHGFNARKVQRETGLSRSTHKSWMHNPEYATMFRLWLQEAAGEARDPDRLLARHDDIVEELLTPKPILHQGAPTGYEEIQAAGAARANETLMKAAGLLKDKDLEVNVGIVGPAFTIQVVQADGTVRDATPRGVTIDLPPPEEADWTE